MLYIHKCIQGLSLPSRRPVFFFFFSFPFPHVFPPPLFPMNCMSTGLRKMARWSCGGDTVRQREKKTKTKEKEITKKKNIGAEFPVGSEV